MATLFISDLHLSAHRPEKLALFRELLQWAAGRVDALYILGDLFEVWVGDDDNTPPYPDIIAALRTVSIASTPLYVMRGNRDFLMGARFEMLTGGRLLPDPYVTEFYGQRVLLMHGDLLCTHDRDYQNFRRKVRNPRWQRRFLSLPLFLRKLSGKCARLRSRLALRHKPAYIMDVDATAVERSMREHGVRLLIHGHTHRPAVHNLTIDGQPALRVVLGDWYEQDSALLLDAGDPQLMRVTDCLRRLGMPSKSA
ncbi:MAG TPA: UDP-2,3-diacylglucosamine diphosphatase [Gammaproteobacteria bacterium]|nr:UDP-2,3-diacylglucosamine diphosphatase [Gammaproteobacteria bacterium]